ncbi:hypothetical protein HKD37_17G048496 [Glycine soja]
MVIMVRTRGLDRVLGRVIGRVLGRQDHHDSDDVPQRRRPTTSARRQRETAPVVEDAPEMTEDVLAPGAEAVDGCEGSAVDDTQGFPGGSRDPSVLTSFADHECPELKLASHGRKRWDKGTSSFHLPVGELTITLDDVASLLHLPIISAFHSFEPLHVDEVVIMLMELLKVSDEEVRAETAQCHGAYCWIYEHFPNVHESVIDEGYDETSPRACWWLTTKAYSKGFTTSTYQTHIDALTIPDGELRWGPIVVTHRPERVTIPPPPIGATLSFEDMNDKWMHYSDHLIAVGQICLDACKAIAERLEHVLNLRMVTASIELHDIMEDCLRIARGVTSDGNVYVRARRRRCTDQ